MEVNEEIIQKVAEQTSYEAMKKTSENLNLENYDLETLLHVGHLVSDPKEDRKNFLTSQQRKYAINALRSWLDDQGNLLKKFSF